MNSRRSAIKKIFLVGTATWLFADDVFASETGTEKQLGAVVDAIIPGSKDLGVHQYILRMMNDCTEEKERKAFLNNLDNLDAYTKTSAGKAFADLPVTQRTSLLKSAPQNLKSFATTARKMTIEGYTNSEYYLTRVVPYVPIPGSFKGCVKVVQS